MACSSWTLGSAASSNFIPRAVPKYRHARRIAFNMGRSLRRGGAPRCTAGVLKTLAQCFELADERVDVSTERRDVVDAVGVDGQLDCSGHGLVELGVQNPKPVAGVGGDLADPPSGRELCLHG